MKRKIEPYYVIVWNFNKDQIDKYNIMDYLIECYKETKKSKKLITPQTFEECKKFILDKSIYMFWSRCEYECIVHGFSFKKNKYKLDVYQQIEMNIDVITKHFMNQIILNNIMNNINNKFVILKFDIMRNNRYLFTYRYKHCTLFILNMEDVKKEIENKYSWIKSQKYEIFMCNN